MPFKTRGRKLANLVSITGLRWALNFDGVGVRGSLSNRAIDVEGDNTFTFYMPSNVAVGTERTIVSQNITNTAGSREFQLFISAVSGNLGVTFGGATFAAADVGSFSAGDLCILSLIGTTSTFRNLNRGTTVVRTFTRGTAREPTAQTILGARTSGSVGVFAGYFVGIQRDFKINETIWPMADLNQSVQPSIPSGNNMTISNATIANWVEVPV